MQGCSELTVKQPRWLLGCSQPVQSVQSWWPSRKPGDAANNVVFHPLSLFGWPCPLLRVMHTLCTFHRIGLGLVDFGWHLLGALWVTCAGIGWFRVLTIHPHRWKYQYGHRFSVHTCHPPIVCRHVHGWCIPGATGPGEGGHFGAGWRSVDVGGGLGGVGWRSGRRWWGFGWR